MIDEKREIEMCWEGVGRQQIVKEGERQKEVKISRWESSRRAEIKKKRVK